ncbi:peptidase M4 [Wenjunlia vitaminophila]|uniref:Neutral metalloproteinase n=1 Tax=Wenjunlia vitaminophila TaxID=76728 RepID=A0A0T6LKP8_WENVI|nr:M4 family metallopeptidase [Wenjunlia vitaminophila]KRV46434.1 peptidase M4 [Wenjunlia vitaminophila]
MDVNPVFCGIVPPHLLDRLADSGSEAVRQAARSALRLDAVHRDRRIGLVSAPTPPARPRAEARPKPHRAIGDAEQHQRLPGRIVRTEGDGPVADPSVNRAYEGLGDTFKLFLDAFSRDSIDGSGLRLNATVHYGRRYMNAFWDGEQMVFGDGDGEIFTDFTKSLDVIGHELAHGVTQYTANLDYQDQSGALNESVSDVFGSLVRQYALGQTAAEADWLIGADLLTSEVEGVALRSLKEPGSAYDDDVLGKDPQPGHMDDYVDTADDNGGVHINSGIPNRAFYLFATELGGHAWERPGQVWYDVLTGGELTPNADFASFARLTVAAAEARFGSGAEVRAVTGAWSRVGVPTRGSDSGTTVPHQAGKEAPEPTS